MDVFRKDLVYRRPRVETLQLHSHGNEHEQGRHQEMTRPVRRIEHRKLRKQRRPFLERAGGRTPFRPVLNQAKVGKRNLLGGNGGTGLLFRCEVPAFQLRGGIPRAKRVVEKERDHVVLGKELRDRREFLCADLHLAGVYGIFSLLLPELVYPAQRIRCAERLRRKSLQKLLEALHLVRGELDLERQRVRTEHARQHFRRAVGSEIPL